MFGFHYRNGFYWKRLDNGDVLLTKTATQAVLHHKGGIPVPEGIDPDQIVADWTLTIDADSWISIVAEMSAFGGTSESHEFAGALHDGDIVTSEGR